MGMEFECLRIEREDGVVWATIDNPPINLMTVGLFAELARFADEVASDEEVRAVVLRSDDPDFFIAHFDVEAILGFPVDAPVSRVDEVSQNPFHAMCETFRRMPKATLVELAGRVGGGGSELAASCDMRFGAIGRTQISQPEVAIGILPGGSGTQRLPRLVGRGRALELILGCDDLDAVTAERWGYLNRALPPAELRPFVDRLARRIAGFPGEAIAAAKRLVVQAEGELAPGLIEEGYAFSELIRSPVARERMKRFLEVGGQTREGELRVTELWMDTGRFE